MPSMVRVDPRRARGVAHASALHDLPDADLVALMAASDADAATEFVGRFQGRVFGLAFTILGDSRAAEDVAQEALLRAWRHAPAYDARRGGVASWALTIGRNLAIDALRLRRAVVVDPDELLGLSPAAGGRDPGDAAVLGADVERLRDALATLPDAQRRAVVLAGVWGCTAAEIAEREEIPLGTAKTRIRMAMEKLRGALVDDVDDSE